MAKKKKDKRTNNDLQTKLSAIFFHTCWLFCSAVLVMALDNNQSII